MNIKPFRSFLILISLTMLLPLLACNSVNDKGNPKLDDIFVRLVQAEKRGEAESFAAQNGLTLKDNKVKVTVFAVSGQNDDAVKAANKVGSDLTSSVNDPLGFDAFVPITKLEALANENSILRISFIQGSLQ